MGEVMEESANIAYSYVQHIFADNEQAGKFFRNNIVHLHIPAGATPKDGPSAGITMACSMYSLVTGRTIRRNLAMTGELTLSGRVFPVGGVKEKVIAARRARVKEIILPAQNKKDLEEIPEYIKKGLKFHAVETITDVIGIAFNKQKKGESGDGGKKPDGRHRNKRGARGPQKR